MLVSLVCEAYVVSELDRNIAHRAVEGRRDPVVPELSGLRADDGRLRVDLGLGDGRLALVLFELLPADEALAEKRGGAAGVALGESEIRLPLRLGGHLIGEIGRLPPGIDLQQGRALPHGLAWLDEDRRHDAAHLRVDGHLGA